MINQKLADNATATSQGTTLQSPLSPEIKITTSWDKGEPPSKNVTMKHSKMSKVLKSEEASAREQFIDGQ
eukprot:10683791-Ditylum_brightwellii.AAC.1